MSSESSESSELSTESDRISIGRIPLKQVRVNRNERESEPPSNPMNRLVPYLDLFCRLDDAELARLGGVEVDVVASLREQVYAVSEGLAAYADLLPRLADAELVRLTGASDRTIRFWRLCQPRAAAASTPDAAPAAGAPSAGAQHAPAEPGVPDPSGQSPTAPHSVVAASPIDNTGRFPSAAAMGDADSNGDGDNSGYVRLSGAPFPGFDEDAAAAATTDGIEDVSFDAEAARLGLGEP